ncbi:uncharacterized protein LOC132552756 [Ylistrum balloti]|uniref:uncharacterized protein LOC132552756 n=1 Tax=Ylistrum balloti TaxID=509963 RepID=UPI0029058EB2|nr:uncharacterized protein LOC132552756 [Ylistrum balloti]
MASEKVYTVGDLFQSATFGDLSSLTDVVKHGVPITSVSLGGSSVLHYAAYGGHTKMVSHLLTNYPECIPKGHDLDMQGYNALHNCCVFSGTIGVFVELVRAGFDTTAKTSKGLTALELAETFKKTDLLQHIRDLESDDSIGERYLLKDETKHVPVYSSLSDAEQRYDSELTVINEDEEGRDMNRRKYTLADLFASAEDGDVERLDNIVSSGIAVDFTTKGGSSVLHFAASKGQTTMIHHLIEKYTFCIEKGKYLDSMGFNALHYAARAGNVDIVRDLIYAGFDLVTRTNDRRSVMDLAREANQTELIRFLKKSEGPDASFTLGRLITMTSNLFTLKSVEILEGRHPEEKNGDDNDDAQIPQCSQTPADPDFTITDDTEYDIPETSSDVDLEKNPDEVFRQWISLHRFSAEGKSLDVLRLIENGADPMKKINSAFFSNLCLESKQMLTPMEVAFYSKQKQTLGLLVRYTADEIVTKCLSECVGEFKESKPYIVKEILRKNYKDKYVDIVFGEYLPKKQKMFVIYTNTISHGSETSEAGYSVCFRNPSVSSDESRKVLYHSHKEGYILSDEDRKLVGRAIKQHSDKLWNRHSNLRGIMSSPVKYKSGRFEKQTCLVILCHFKGFVPDNEPLFPTEVEVGDVKLPVDIREGNVVLHHVQCPDALHKPLSFGCNIGAADDTTMRFGSVGPFVQLENDKVGFITCAHVVHGNSRYVGDSVPDIDVVQPSNGGTEHPEDDRKCGKVVYFKYSLDEETSIDVAVVEITEPQRVPPLPGFSAYSQEQFTERGFPEHGPDFNHGEFGEPTVGHEIIKFGSASGITYGTYRGIEMTEFSSKIYGKATETERWRGVYYIENRQCSEQDCQPPPFSTPGDSGAGVFQVIVNEDNSRSLICVGVLVGADTATGSGIVIPIKPILETFGLRLKVFQPTI